MALWILRCIQTRLTGQIRSLSLLHGKMQPQLRKYTNEHMREPQLHCNVLHNACSRQIWTSFVCQVKKEKLEPGEKQRPPKQNDVLVFNSSGMHVGKMPLSKAEDRARKDGLKLVDIGINQDKVSCYKLLTGKEYYEESMKMKSQKAADKSTEQKEVQFTAKISDHDLSIKVDQIQKFLKKGKSVKIVVKGNKRYIENDTKQQQSAVLKNISEKVQDIALVKRATKTTFDLTFVLIPKDTSEQPQSSSIPEE